MTLLQPRSSRSTPSAPDSSTWSAKAGLRGGGGPVMTPGGNLFSCQVGMECNMQQVPRQKEEGGAAQALVGEGSGGQAWPDGPGRAQTPQSSRRWHGRPQQI